MEYRTVSLLAVCILLLSTLVAVASAQEEDCTYTPAIPYITFMGSQLPNHSYVDIGLLGNADDGRDVLQCHTDLATCCRSGMVESVTHTGEWFLPNGLPVDSSSGDYRVREGDQQIDLAYDGSGGSTGIFRCAVPTDAVNDVSNTARESVYVGIYQKNSLGIEDVFLTVDSDLNGDSPQFTLACISSGGPASCIVWRIDKRRITDPITTSVLTDSVAGRYTHTLTVTERIGGTYSCSVANDKPTSEYEGFYVKTASEPLNISVVQDGPTSLHVYWVLSGRNEHTNGYRIYYTGGSNGIVDVEDEFVDNYLLTGLVNAASYTVSIAAKSPHLPSRRVESSPIQLVPGAPELRIYSATSATVSFSWSLPRGSVVDSYEVNWDRDHDRFASFNEELPASTNNYTISELEGYGNATFSISVTAYNSAGSKTSSTMSFAANFAAGNSKNMDPVSPSDSGSDDDILAIVGAVVGGCVILSIAVVVAALLIYHYKKSQSKKEDTAKPEVYMLAGPPTASTSSFPTGPPALPPPRPEIQTFNNRSYTPTSAGATATDLEVADYTYPNPGPFMNRLQQQQQVASNGSTAEGVRNGTTSTGDGYDYMN